MRLPSLASSARFWVAVTLTEQQTGPPDARSTTGSELTEITKRTPGIETVFLLYISKFTARPIKPLPAFYELKERSSFSSGIRSKDDSILRDFHAVTAKKFSFITNQRT
jgi:hypothetical protein